MAGFISHVWLHTVSHRMLSSACGSAVPHLEREAGASSLPLEPGGMVTCFAPENIESVTM